MIPLHSRDSIFSGWGSERNPKIVLCTEQADMPEVVARKHALIVDSLEDVAECKRRRYGVVLARDGAGDEGQPSVGLDPALSYLGDGDVVRLNPAAKEVRTLFRVGSEHNSLLVTERCNSFCLMCSQPPRDIDDSYLVDEVCRTLTLIRRETKSVGITGGEPTLLGRDFVTIVRQARNYLPSTFLHVLSNGRKFSDRAFVREVAQVQHPHLMFGIPLYSDQADLHDFVVQARGAFDETVKGIINLKAEGLGVELRVVIHKQTYGRLAELARFIARNLTFVDHVALMGLELTGFTKGNLKALWVDPYEYREQLEEAVRVLDNAKVPVMIYNHQLCILPERARRFSVRSISDWKNDYLEVCSGCARRDECGGFFSSGIGMVKHSRHIRPFSDTRVRVRPQEA